MTDDEIREAAELFAKCMYMQSPLEAAMVKKGLMRYSSKEAEEQAIQCRKDVGEYMRKEIEQVVKNIKAREASDE